MFNIPYLKYDKFTTTKKTLGYINSLLCPYSLKIISNKKKNNGYNLDFLNNIDEILQCKINDGYTIKDKDNIFFCNKNNLEELY